jgi:hypothetical protein
MINMLFFLKYKAQLRRTRPDIVRQVDETLIRAISDAGGKITFQQSIICAVFNEEATGFWLDIYILIENLKKSMDTLKDFFGYSLVISADFPNNSELLCRFLANNGGGIFMDIKAAKKFLPYAFIQKPDRWLKRRKTWKYGSGGFYKIKELKIFNLAVKNDQIIQDEVVRILGNEWGKNILISGREYSQIRSGINIHCKNLNGSFPVLTICFGSMGLGPLVDAWSPNIRSLSGSQPTEEIDALWELLFRDRVRDEVSQYIKKSVKRFLALLLDHYIRVAHKKNCVPVLVLENIHLAQKMAAELLLSSLAEINNESRRELVILGTGEGEFFHEKTRQWESVFDDVKKIEDESENRQEIPKLPDELWEIVYAISLLGRFFSPELFQRLFEEDDKNPVMIARSFSILQTLGVIDNPREPRLMCKSFEKHAFDILGEKTIRIKAFVCGRLLSWAAGWNINPCFRLLTIIVDLGGASHIDDLLLLKSILSDIVNETVPGLEMAIKKGHLEKFVSSEKAGALKLIFQTSRALYGGNEKDIDNIFTNSESESDFESFPLLNAQLIVNQCGYYLGKRDKNAASEKAKEAILLGQKTNAFCLPQAYRLFSLVCLSKQQTAETIEYLNLALSNAEKTGNYYEMGVSAYYAAASQFLYGDLYSARVLVRKSIEQSLTAGCADWADRSYFLEGRLNFELGLYSQAHDIFETLYNEPFGSITEEKKDLFAAWSYRCKIYFQDPTVYKPEGANHDMDMFEIEAAYLARDYRKAVELADSTKNSFSKDNFLFTERAVWQSGYDQCEHLFFPCGEIQNRMICLFRSMALSRSVHGGEKAMQDIQQLLREELPSEIDPSSAFNFYVKYRILEQTGASMVDMSTAVSMAFKRLQRRASRIEDIETRRQYLNGPRWNRELCLAAKDFKLI